MVSSKRTAPGPLVLFYFREEGRPTRTNLSFSKSFLTGKGKKKFKNGVKAGGEMNCAG